jgi:hypothetical protein
MADSSAAAAAVVASPRAQLLLPDWAHARGVEVAVVSTLLLHPLDLTQWAALAALPSLLRRTQAMARAYELRHVAMAAARCTS